MIYPYTDSQTRIDFSNWTQVDFDAENYYFEAREWCRQQFGPEDFCHLYQQYFFFRNAEDAMMFKLRWS